MCFGNSKLYFKRSCNVCVRSTNETFNLEGEAKPLSCICTTCGWKHQTKCDMLFLMSSVSSSGCNHQRLWFTACWLTAYTSTFTKVLLWWKSSQLNLQATWGEAQLGYTPSLWDWIYKSNSASTQNCLCSSCFPSTEHDKANKIKAKYPNLKSSS